MRIPWISKDVYLNLSPSSIKVLCLIAAKANRGRLIITLSDLAPYTAMCETVVRRAIRELGEAGLLDWKSSTRGYVFHIPYTKRFTYIPSLLISLMSVSPGAVKAFVAICRVLRPSMTVRMLIRTICAHVGRKRRAVQGYMSEIYGSGLAYSYRTGRSNIIVVEKNDDPLFRPDSAHRSRTLLRILSSTPKNILTSTLGSLRRKETVEQIRDAHPLMGTSVQSIGSTLKIFNISRDEIHVLSSMYTENELVHATTLLMPKRVKDPYSFIHKVISRGWCKWVI